MKLFPAIHNKIVDYLSKIKLYKQKKLNEEWRKRLRCELFISVGLSNGNAKFVYMIIAPNIGYHLYCVGTRVQRHTIWLAIARYRWMSCGLYAFRRYIQRMRMDCFGTHRTNDINDNVDPSIRSVCQIKNCDILIKTKKKISHHRSYQIITSPIRCCLDYY